MKCKYKLLILLATVFSFGTACNKYLDVQPDDKISVSALLKDENGFSTFLLGIYNQMAAEELYGGKMTMELVDVLGQQYDCYYNGSGSGQSHTFGLLQKEYNYAQYDGHFGTVWTKMYNTIANVNTLIDYASQRKNLFANGTDSIILGEAHAIRAYLYFDLLRLFGPVYSQDSTLPSIPYYTTKIWDPAPYMPANQVMNNIVQDLAIADSLLLYKDPIVTKSAIKSNIPSDFYNTNRQLRLNYYAVKLLQARVFLYRGNKAEALAAANEVLSHKALFPYTSLSEVTNSNSPDRVASTELVFTFYNSKLESSYNAYYRSQLPDSTILKQRGTRLDQLFADVAAKDYRFKTIFWQYPSDNSKSDKCFMKYGNMPAFRSYRNYVPGLKLAEALLIAAECNTDPIVKFQYLDELRTNRGGNAALNQSTANVAEEIEKEYQREFIGEGQLFFYYKRLFKMQLKYGASDASTIYMTASMYKALIPKCETDVRN